MVVSAVGAAVSGKKQSVRHRLSMSCLQTGETAWLCTAPSHGKSPRVTSLAEATWKQVNGSPGWVSSRLPGQLTRAAQIRVRSSGVSVGLDVGPDVVGSDVVGPEVGAELGAADGSIVGDKVGAGVGAADATVGDGVAPVGDRVGGLVGVPVVGAAVHDATNRSPNARLHATVMSARVS